MYSVLCSYSAAKFIMLIDKDSDRYRDRRHPTVDPSNLGQHRLLDNLYSSLMGVHCLCAEIL